MSPRIERITPPTSACSNRLGCVGGSRANPVTSASSAFSHKESQPPLKPVCPVRKTRRPFQNERFSMVGPNLTGLAHWHRLGRRRRRTLRPARELFAPQRFHLTVGWHHHIGEGNHRILRNIPNQYAAFGKSDRQSFHLTSGAGIVDQAVVAEATNAIQQLAGLQIPLGDRNYFANRPANWSDGGVLVNDCAADGRADLDMRQMERRVEHVERTVPDLVIAELRFF